MSGTGVALTAQDKALVALMPGRYHSLGKMVGVKAAANGSRVSGGGFATPTPINDDIADLRLDIADVMRSWAETVADETCHDLAPYGRDVRMLATFILGAWTHVQAQHWAEDMADEFRNLTHRADVYLSPRDVKADQAPTHRLHCPHCDGTVIAAADMSRIVCLTCRTKWTDEAEFRATKPGPILCPPGA